MRNRLEQLEENLQVLEHIKVTKTLDEILISRDVQWSIRYGLMESIQIAIDISCHLCGKNNLGVPENYGDCVRKIAQFEYITRLLEKKLLSIIGLRNLLIHEYAVIEISRLYRFLGDLDVFRDFIQQVSVHV